MFSFHPSNHPSIHSFIHALHTVLSVDQVHYSRYSMAALRPALSWSFFYYVYKSPAMIYPPLLALASRARAVHMSK